MNYLGELVYENRAGRSLILYQIKFSYPEVKGSEPNVLWQVGRLPVPKEKVQSIGGLSDQWVLAQTLASFTS